MAQNLNTLFVLQVWAILFTVKTDGLFDICFARKLTVLQSILNYFDGLCHMLLLCPIFGKKKLTFVSRKLTFEKLTKNIDQRLAQTNKER